MSKTDSLELGGIKEMEKMLYLLATFDNETSKKIDDIQQKIKDIGIIDKQTPNIPNHITLTCYKPEDIDKVKKLFYDICLNTKSFNLDFDHIGLFGMRVMFLAPRVNYDLLKLYDSLNKNATHDSKEWTAHSTILISEEEDIIKVLPIVALNFKLINAKIEGISLYEFFPTKLISTYKLKT